MKKNICLLGLLPICMIGACIAGFLNKPTESKYADLVSENVEALTKSSELPEVVIICGTNKGKCWMEGIDLKFCKEYSYYECIFTGNTKMSCEPPC